MRPYTRFDYNSGLSRLFDIGCYFTHINREYFFDWILACARMTDELILGVQEYFPILK